MNIIGVIPARMASTRFPGKPLAKIRGIPMIGHVYLRSKMSCLMNAVYIATCDEAILEYAKAIGAPCVMTASTHERASDRAAEATLKIEQASGSRIDVVMMIQGDEPMVLPEVLDAAIRPLLTESGIDVVNLITAIGTAEDFESPNVVKIVVGLNGNALYLSREPIPSRKKTAQPVPMFKQLGLIAFRRDYLQSFYTLAPTPLEKIESVDVLRVLEHGGRLRTVIIDLKSVGVDTVEDLCRVERLMADDPLISKYAD
jgi:3-deoxy-manno-octulosonate cytidylyltransferase (CMP-KDO synthetase)